jgi:hypothetical protein
MCEVSSRRMRRRIQRICSLDDAGRRMNGWDETQRFLYDPEFLLVKYEALE